MAYFKHRDLIVEAEQYFFRGKKKNNPPDLIPVLVKGQVICGQIESGGRLLFVQHGDWIVYSQHSKSRIIIKDDVFNDFFQDVTE